MTDQRYDIAVEDKVAPSIADKLERIRVAALGGNEAVEKLRLAIASIDGRALEQMSAAAARWQRTNDASALSAQRLATETQRTSAAAAAATSAQQRLAQAQTASQTAAQRLATAQAQTATATSNAAAAATRAATAQLNQQRATLALQRAQQGAANTLQGYVRNTLQIAGTAFGVAAILRAADAYTTLQNKLQVVAKSQEQVVRLTDQLFEVANRTLAPVEETATAFARFDRALANLGKSQQESLRLTETVNKMLVISGSTAGEAGAALLQLSQAFNKGKLDGDEFRTVMELMPSAADAIAKELGVTRGELLKLAPEGKITAQVMANAFSKAASEVDATFGKAIPTLSQSTTVLRNNFVQAVGEFDKATGISRTLSAIILGLANNMRALGVVLAALSSAMAVAFGPRLIGFMAAATGAVRGFTVALAANPIGLIVVALTAAIAALVIFSDKIETSSDGVVTLRDTAQATFEIIGEGASKLATTVGDVFSGITDTLKAIFERLPDFLKPVISGAEKISTLLNPAILLFKAAKPALDKAVDTVQERARAIALERQLTPVTASVRKIQPSTLSTVDKSAEKRALALAKVNLQLDNEMQRLGQLQPMREAQARFDQIEETLLGKKIKLNAEEAASIRSKIDSIQKALQVQQQMDRIYEDAVGPLRDYNNSVAAAEDLLARGAITQEQFSRAMVGATEAYLNSADSLRQVNKEIEDQNALLGFVGPQLEVEQRLQQIVNDQLSKNVVLTQEQIDTLREKLALQQRAVEQQRAEAAVYDATVGAAQRYFDQLEAISKLKQQGVISGGQAAQQIIEANPDFDFDLTQTGIDAHVQQFEDMYARIDELRQKNLINEQTAAALRAQVWAQQQEAQLKHATDFFGQLSLLTKSENSKIAAIGKAAAITKAVIDTYTAANAAYASMAGIPYVGPVLGAAAAAAAIVAGMANVNAIRSQGSGQGFMQGGYTGNLPTTAVAGPVHGQEYVMDAAATRRIGVANLDAMRRGAANVNQNVPNWNAMAAKGSSSTTVNQRIVNVMDKGIVGDYISSPEGEDVLINFIGRNADRVRSVVS